jgi:phage-related protein
LFFKIKNLIDNKFEIVLLAEAFEFLKSLDIKHSTKILFNIRKSQQKNDPELFKKLTDEIWEFRTLFQGLQYRMLAFWDKTDNKNTLVISTHGFIKKQSKVPENEISKAEVQRKKYFQDNLKNKK